MITFQQKQLLIDGKPTFLLSGELHYFRQPKENWQYLLDEAKMLGLNCIASYIPWILHEEAEGEYNFSDNLDLAAFLELIKENCFYFFLRPGPFIMAEMKNEGLPYWIAQKYPSAIPVGFDGEKKPSTTLDYNADKIYLRPTQNITTVSFIGDKTPISDTNFKLGKKDELTTLTFSSCKSLLTIHFTS